MALSILMSFGFQGRPQAGRRYACVSGLCSLRWRLVPDQLTQGCTAGQLACSTASVAQCRLAETGVFACSM